MLVLSIVFAIVALVLLVQLLRYKKELRQMAQFLNERDKDSNSSVRVDVHSKSILCLAEAINTETDERRAERIADLVRQHEMQVSLAHLSHDIRTPLTGARGYVQLLEDEADPQLRKHYLVSIERRLDDLNHLLNQLFMFTQVNDPEHQLEIETVDVNEVLSQALLAFYPQFQEKGFDVEVDFASEESFVLADREALSRIMQNLVSNAFQHGSSFLRIEQKGTDFCFLNRVNDPASLEVDRLFERFYKSDSTRSGQGSGLGLAIVAQLIDSMGASVKAEMKEDVLRIDLSFRSTS